MNLVSYGLNILNVMFRYWTWKRGWHKAPMFDACRRTRPAKAQRDGASVSS